MSKKLFAFTGQAGSGKDTAAGFLSSILKERGENFILTFSFAEFFKKIIHATFKIDEKEAEIIKRMQINPFNGLTLREVYQNFAEEMKNKINNDIWVDIVFKQIKTGLENLETLKYIICTDLRYKHERDSLIEFCREEDLDLIIIKMINLNQQSIMEHSSEKETQEIDANFTIKGSTPAEIEIQLKEILNEIF